MAATTIIIGVDPAPAKPAALWTGDGLRRVPAIELPRHIAKVVAENERVVIAWDAPLRFDARHSMSDRPVDRVVRAWCKQRLREGVLAPKAVSVLPFAGCPHWAITCASLGFPYGTPPSGLRVASAPDDGERLVVEVHPAVAMAMRWCDLGLTDAFPRYKGDPAACRRIGQALAFPEDAWVDDDALDAYAAFWLAESFLSGAATLFGWAVAGGYVLPVGPSLAGLQHAHER